MALLDDHAEAGADEDGARPGSKDAKKKHRDNLLIIGIALVGVILTYLIYRSNKSSQSSSATQLTTPVGTAGQLVGGSGTTNATDPYAEAGINQLQTQFQQQGQALSGLQSALENLSSEVSNLQNTPPTAPAQQPTAAPATPGYGYINLPGVGQSVILGYIGQGDQYTGYNVGGGAPVFFGNANQASQGPGQEQVGSYAYTPVGYASLVGNSPTTEVLPGSH